MSGPGAALRLDIPDPVDLVTGETLARVQAQSSPDGVAWSPIGR